MRGDSARIGGVGRLGAPSAFAIACARADWPEVLDGPAYIDSLS